LKDRFGIAAILRVLDVAASTYYGWLAQERDRSVRRRNDAQLLAEITEIHERSGGTYGSPRVHAILRRRGRRVSRKRVERLMRENGLQGAFLRKRWRVSSTRQDPHASPAPDLVNRDFTAPAPDRLWVADATRIPCGEGVIWLAAVRDVFSNRIVGWRCSDRCDTDLILKPDLRSPSHPSGEMRGESSWRLRRQSHRRCSTHTDAGPRTTRATSSCGSVAA
jgi:putative transposase